MRLREAVASALHLLVVLSWFALGALVLLLWRRPEWNQIAIDVLTGEPQRLIWVAISFSVVGLFFLFGFFKIGRGRYLRVEMCGGKPAIDSKIIRQAIEDCFRENYPAQLRSASVSVVKGKCLEIGLDLAGDDKESELELLSEIEPQLLELLRSRFGYSDPISLYVRSTAR